MSEKFDKARGRSDLMNEKNKAIFEKGVCLFFSSAQENASTWLVTILSISFQESRDQMIPGPSDPRTFLFLFLGAKGGQVSFTEIIDLSRREKKEKGNEKKYWRIS